MNQIATVFLYLVGGVGALVCLSSSFSQFAKGNSGLGIGLLLLSPVVFFAVYFLTAIVLIVVGAIALIALISWLLAFFA